MTYDYVMRNAHRKRSSCGFDALHLLSAEGDGQCDHIELELGHLAHTNDRKYGLSLVHQVCDRH